MQLHVIVKPRHGNRTKIILGKTKDQYIFAINILILNINKRTKFSMASTSNDVLDFLDQFGIETGNKDFAQLIADYTSPQPNSASVNSNASNQLLNKEASETADYLSSFGSAETQNLSGWNGFVSGE